MIVVYDKFVKASHLVCKTSIADICFTKTTISRQIVDSFMITIFLDKIYIDFFAYTKLFFGGRFETESFLRLNAGSKTRKLMCPWYHQLIISSEEHLKSIDY